MDCIQLCSIERYWFGNRTHSKFDVWFCWIAKLNQTQSTGWIWLRLISPCLIDYTRMCISSTLGNSRKYPYPTTASFIVLTPALPLEILECVTSPSPQNSIIVNPPTLRNFCFFWKYIFDLATPIWTKNMNLCLLNVVIWRRQVTSFTLQQQKTPTACDRAVQTPF